MKAMKRILLLLLALVMCIGTLAACTPETETTEGGTTTAPDNGGENNDPSEDVTTTKPEENNQTPGEDGIPIAEARKREVGVEVKVTGVVARITYSFGKKPAGVYLIDSTGSIYIYDATLASQVAIGHRITVTATRANWILEDEQTNAAKFGYNGCIQLENPTLNKHDKNTYEFDKSWIPTSTVRDIIETPVSEPVTSSVFKVTALVKKEPGTGFVNYYFYDLDATTRAYTYTQCNGSDFAWLDEFDGKICTVYLSPINAKSTATDCYFRLLPVAVIDEHFTFNLKDAPKLAVDYYGVPQFEAVYTGDPAQELVTVVNSELLGFEGVTLSYTSDNTDVISIVENVLHCNAVGEANIIVKATYNGNEYSTTVKITVKANEEFESITVKEAQETADDETVTVRGIVGPSVVNKEGFYLIDDTGMIAVIVKNTDTFASIKIGDEVVLTGRRECYKKASTGDACFGQTSIVEAEILANYYGENQYNTDFFITDKTLADIKALNIKEDHTTEVYVVKATVEVIRNQYYTNLNLVDGTTTLLLYANNAAADYAFLLPYEGQEITIEIAPCNWNDKKDNYRGCVLAVHLDDGTVIYNERNFQ